MNRYVCVWVCVCNVMIMNDNWMKFFSIKSNLIIENVNMWNVEKKWKKNWTLSIEFSLNEKFFFCKVQLWWKKIKPEKCSECSNSIHWIELIFFYVSIEIFLNFQKFRIFFCWNKTIIIIDCGSHSLNKFQRIKKPKHLRIDLKERKIHFIIAKWW